MKAAWNVTFSQCTSESQIAVAAVHLQVARTLAIHGLYASTNLLEICERVMGLLLLQLLLLFHTSCCRNNIKTPAACANAQALCAGCHSGHPDQGDTAQLASNLDG
jgi:hypothetical protein